MRSAALQSSPKSAAAAVAAAPEDASSASLPQIHVLAVDDSIVDRKVIENLLKTSSYKVTTVDSALGALEILGIVDGESPAATTEIQFSMIITDYCMPHMTGYDLLKRVKGTSFLKEIPVVIMSSEKVETRINSCYEEGADDFIIKPVRADDLKRICAHFRPASPNAAAASAAATINSKKRKRSSSSTDNSAAAATLVAGDLITCN